MADKIFGTDFANTTSPVSTWTISVNDGSQLLDVTLGNLLKAIFPDGDYGDFSTVAQVFTIDAGAVTLAKIVNASGQYKLLGRSTAGAGVWQEISSSADLFTFLGAVNYAAMRTQLGLVIGTNVQAWDADLDTWAGKTAPSGTVVGTSDTQSLTNKNVQPRVVAVTSSATPTYNTDNGDLFRISSLAAAITSMVTNKTGTPIDGQEMDWEILDDGTARAIVWGADFASAAATLPTSTTVNKWLFVKLRWSSSRSKWMCLATGSEV